MAGRQSEKTEWMTTAERFLLQGDFKAMRACAREILARNLDDMDGLALLAEASLYLGEVDAAVRLVHRIKASAPQNLRALLVESILAAGKYRLEREITLLEQLWSLGMARAEEELPVYERGVLERGGCRLADAYYLLAEPEKAARMMFALSGFMTEPVRKAELYSKALFMTNYYSLAASRSLTLHEGYNAFFGAKVTLPHKEREEGERKLRIGYISPDFREHAVANFLSPFLQEYSKLDFTVYCYMTGQADEVTKRFRRFAVAWRDIRGLGAQEAARRIYEDHIDILVDFSGHSQDSCLPVLAYRPAPIQLSGIGYVNTTGLHEVDYFISDACCMPPGEKAHGFTEQIARLPHSHLCYAPELLHRLPAPGTVPPAQSNGFVTFGSFNNFAKVSDETLLLWRAVLEQVPRARLVIKGKIASIPDGRNRVLERFRDFGIDGSRLELRPYSPDYLEQYRDIDIALDTAPYTGGLTTCEALVMGVPVVSLRGTTHGSRFGASILENAGVSELVAESEMEYVNKAVQIARTPSILAQFHAGLREALLHSRLMDSAGYMREIEQLYRQLWQLYCRQ